MPRRKAQPSDKPPKKMRPALTPEANENQAISMAFDLAKQRLADGTASAQEVVYFLKLGSTKEKLEREMLEKQNEMLEAKTENLKSSTKMEELYNNALDAMKAYSGQGGEDNYGGEE